eukprot:52426_1
MGDRKLVSCLINDDRDTVARILEKHHTHHVIVVDEAHSRFMGIVSSWDVAAECAKDNMAWPYLRGDDGKIQLPPERIEKVADHPMPPAFDPHKPTTVVNHPHDKATTYMDDLDLEGLQ